MKIEINIEPDIVIAIAEDLHYCKNKKETNNINLNPATTLFLRNILKSSAIKATEQMNEAEDLTNAIKEATNILAENNEEVEHV